ncbi:MAG: ABC transporter permease [Thermoplasmata archaeon]|nr:ABC transporter permease [Thermoplasmata archaeon]
MRYAWDALRRRPGRSIASALGIGLATALVVTLLAVSTGIQDSAARLATESGVDLIVTSANSSLSGGAFPSFTGAHHLPGGFRAADGNVETASPWLIASLTFANRSLYDASNASEVPGDWSPTSSGAVGWIPGESGGLELPPVLDGPGYPTLSDPHYANGSYNGASSHAIVLDQGLASILHVAPGDLVWASKGSPSGPSALPAWFADAQAFRVVGISGPFWLLPSALLGFVYLSELQTLQSAARTPSDAASLVLVHLTDPTQASTDQSILQKAFPMLSVFTLSDILTTIQQTVDLYRTFGTLIGLVGLVVATLFATTILLMSVDDRSRELALLRAIGYPRSAIVRFVAEEGFLLAGFGLLAGLGLGVIGSLALERALERIVHGLPAGFSFVQFDAAVVGWAVLEIVVVALLASILPAIWALQIPISEELRAP